MSDGGATSGERMRRLIADARGAAAVFAVLAVALLGLIGVAPAGQVAAQEAPARQLQRFGGENRIATAVTVSQETFAPGVGVVFVSRSDDFADALVGGVVAGRQGGP